MKHDSQLPYLLTAAELSLCLSRLFLAPQTQVTLAEVRGPLLDDLRDLAETLPALDPERLEALSKALAALTDTQQFILGYSRLFLMPPAPAPLNLGAYLDGGLMARSVPAMEALFHRHGLERDPAFRDLPDHLSLHLQWLAWVYSEAMEACEAGANATPALSDAATLLHDFTLPALAGIRRKVTQAADDATTLPWRLLVELTHDQLAQDLAQLEAAVPLPRPSKPEPPMTTISPLSVVTVEYVLTDEAGQRLAASTPGTPLQYVHGTGQMLPALEAALEGRRTDDELSVTLSPEQAYGPYRPELVFEAVRENLPPGLEVREGMTLTPGGQGGKFSLKVVGLTERGAMLDGNHPLAGKTVTWTLHIRSVSERRASQGEVEYQPIHWVAVE